MILYNGENWNNNNNNRILSLFYRQKDIFIANLSLFQEQRM